jgi:hypothetical protein
MPARGKLSWKFLAACPELADFSKHVHARLISEEIPMTRIPSVIAPLLILLSATQSVQAADAPPLQWNATYVEEAPSLDGSVEALWNVAQPLTVTVREAFGGRRPVEVLLRAVYTDDSLFVLAEWPDATRSDRRDPYIWNSTSGSYERPTTPDDQFALEFPLSGDFQQTMLPASGTYRADVWHWKAGRSNLDGWVDDKSHHISTTPVENALVYELGPYNTVYIYRPMDSGVPSYVVVDPPAAFTEQQVPSFAPQQPSGSVADVRGKGIHDGNGWTLEMGRRFSTGHDDDRQIDPGEAITCAIAILNDELYWEHSVSDLIELHFQPAR